MSLEKIVCRVLYVSKKTGKLEKSFGEISKWQLRNFSNGVNNFIILENGGNELTIYKGDIKELTFYKRFSSLAVDKSSFSLCKSIKTLSKAKL